MSFWKLLPNRPFGGYASAIKCQHTGGPHPAKKRAVCCWLLSTNPPKTAQAQKRTHAHMGHPSKGDSNLESLSFKLFRHQKPPKQAEPPIHHPTPPPPPPTPPTHPTHPHTPPEPKMSPGVGGRQRVEGQRAPAAGDASSEKPRKRGFGAASARPGHPPEIHMGKKVPKTGPPKGASSINGGFELG